MQAKTQTALFFIIGLTVYCVVNRAFPVDLLNREDKIVFAQDGLPHALKSGSINTGADSHPLSAQASLPTNGGLPLKEQAQTDIGNIDEQCIRNDLMGKTLGSIQFGQRTLSRIRLNDTRYQGGKALLSVSFKAVNHVRQRPGWIGKSGQCNLQYAHANGKWSLMYVEVISMKNLTFCEIDNMRKTHGFPFLTAVDEGEIKAVKSHLAKGVNIYARSRKGETALMIAASQGHVNIAELLIDKGLPVDAVTPDGRTALMIASNLGQAKMVACLLRHGAEPNYRGPLGYTALMVALEKKLGPPSANGTDRLPILRILLNSGAAVNVKDDRGITPLWLAIKNQNEKAVQLLSARGANVNGRLGSEGYTPLMEAIKIGNLAIVEILLDKGAHTTTEVNGVTPMRLARMCPMRWEEKTALMHMLRKAQAKK